MTESCKLVLNGSKGEAKLGSGDNYQRMLIMASNAFIKMMEALNVFGSAGTTMFYMMGQEKGRYDVLEIIKNLRSRRISFTNRWILEKIIQQGKRVQSIKSPQEIRKRILEQLGKYRKAIS